MTEPKLKARLAVQAIVRQCGTHNLPAVVAARGEDEAGALMIRLNRGQQGCELFTQTRDAEGRLAWMRPLGPEPVPEAKADAAVARARSIDRDLWVIDIEINEGRPPFLDPVL